MGQFCSKKEIEIEKTVQRRKSSSNIRTLEIKESLILMQQGEQFQSTKNEIKYFYSMKIMPKIENKVNKISSSHQKGEKLQISQIQQMNEALEEYIKQLLIIQEKFQLYGDEEYEESEKGYIESEGYSLPFESSFKPPSYSNAHEFKAFTPSEKIIPHNDFSKKHHSMAKLYSEKDKQIYEKENNNNININTNHSSILNQKDEQKEMQSIIDGKDNDGNSSNVISTTSSNDAFSQIKANSDPSELFGRIAEKLEQSMLIVELHKLMVQQSTCNIEYFRLSVEVLLEENRKKQRKIFTTQKIEAKGNQTEVNEVFEFLSEIELQCCSYAKFKVRLFIKPSDQMIDCLNQNISNVQINQNEYSQKTTLCSSRDTFNEIGNNNKNNNIDSCNQEIEFQSDPIDLLFPSYLQQNIEYIQLRFVNKSYPDLKACLLARFQLVYHQASLVSRLLSQLVSQKDIISKILSSLS